MDNDSILIRRGSLLALIGYISSGPLGSYVALSLFPQPAWVSAEVFAHNYHFVQDMPFVLGVFLLSGTLMIFAGHYIASTREEKPITLIALVFAIVFMTLIFFNYIVQTTFVRNLALNYNAEHDPAIAIFSMSNPLSLAWSIEMCGYGILGIATWILASYYKSKNKFISVLLIANGIMSIMGAIVTVIDIHFVMTKWGLLSYGLWNVLMIILMILIYRYSLKPTT